MMKHAKHCAICNGSRGVFKLTKPICGTPQGGVIFPLLANIFLNEMDKAFHCPPDSPLYFANARLIRHADDSVVMVRYIGRRITDWLEELFSQGLSREMLQRYKFVCT
ncbi:MAG: hypothetical protein K8F52_05305 [Candidatus Scalindua rubra]|nr:hypothetical protein [Candidatus Scalindua rubra]